MFKKIIYLFFITLCDSFLLSNKSFHNSLRMNNLSNDYLNSLNSNNAIIKNIKDILKFDIVNNNSNNIISYSDIIIHNKNNNINSIIILNNNNNLFIKTNDNKLLSYKHSKKIDILGLLNIIYYFYR